MPKIKLLPSNLVNQIAAGEVIERPASIVKELIENAIDASSTSINIHIEDGGQKSITIIDNGIGMSKDDLKMAFQRHATSKISSPTDLEKISTLGFRGEALPSIASISQLKCKSIENNKNEGYEIVIHGGDEVSFSPMAGVQGTQIKISNIFYNVPARRKFLKKSDTEKKKITEIVRRFMLSNPEISFALSADGKEIYNVNASNLEQRITDIFGKQFQGSLLPVSYGKPPYSITGFTGNLNTVKKRQGNQYIFLNGRFISDRLLNSAAFSSYKSLLSRGEFPFFVLFLNVPLNMIDVNVHPAKLEVRFENEWHIYHVIKTAITNALSDILKVIPEYDPSNIYFQKPQKDTEINLPFPTQHTSTSFHETPPILNRNQLDSGLNEKALENDFPILDRANGRIVDFQSGGGDFAQELSKDENIAGDIIWQLHNKYLITEIKSGLIIVDQHVAHERVLYEISKKAINGNGLPSQTVLFPQTLTLQPDEYSSLLNIIPYLNKIGFKMREFGENTVIIEGIPNDVHWGSEKEVILQILDKFIEYNELDASFIDYLASTFACKAAIKAGDPLTMEERKHLIDKLFSTEHPYYCPHGRPIIINLTLDDLDKRFERH